jgi:hypothetical protein
MNASERAEQKESAERAHPKPNGVDPSGSAPQQGGEPPQPIVILVDASNAAYGQSSGPSQAKIGNLTRVLTGVEQAGIRPVALADASLRYKIDAKSELEAMLNAGAVEQVPAGTSADDFLWQLWKRHRAKGERAFIVTNDQFPAIRAREEGFDENPRVTFMLLREEVFFQPPIEQLVSRRSSALSGEQPRHTLSSNVAEPKQRPFGEVIGGPTPSRASYDLGKKSAAPHPSIEKLVGAAMRVIAYSTGPRGESGRRINFAGVANDLHVEFGGDYVSQFGLRRPKDLALLLSDRGLVTVTFAKATMYIEPTPAFDDQVKGLPRLVRTATELPRIEEAVGPSPAAADSAPLEPRTGALPEVIEVSAGAPAPVVEIGDPETFVKLAQDHHALHIFHWPCGVYSNDYRSRFRIGGEFFFTSDGTSFRLWGLGYKSVEDFLDARRHGFRGSNRERIVGDRYGNEGIPAIHTELEELVDPHRDGFMPEEGDVYYCARAAGFDDFASFLADRSRKSKEDSGFR